MEIRDRSNQDKETYANKMALGAMALTGTGMVISEVIAISQDRLDTTPAILAAGLISMVAIGTSVKNVLKNRRS